MKARGAGVAALLLALACVLLPAARASADGPALRLDRTEAGKGAVLTVSGTGWRPRTLLTLLVCGQDMIGGTDSCANADGRTATTGADGRFSTRIPVAEPPKPCPCVVHVATVTGDPVAVDAALKVAGHPVASLPPRTGGERLGVLDARLEGSGGLLTWFGAPPHRRLVVTLGNLGSTPAKDPVFEVGTSHGVLAPEWEKQHWRGTIAAGGRARVPLDVELAAGAYGDYQVSLKYGDKVLVEEPWAVGRPWGVTLFWILLCVVVSVGVFRVGMAVVGRVRPAERPEEARDGSLPWFRPEADPTRATEASGGGAHRPSTTRAKARPPDEA
ncbi:neocarzinostatin apoprotein domain-containing protein [Streptomyces sp. NPDC020379]|uniref:neocarzinostatin apoprotein domain-containing protein n=1 Tax=Streptomyces sp. NPDC020379 TaxID=3365071 RepID=UPI00379DF216